MSALKRYGKVGLFADGSNYFELNRKWSHTVETLLRQENIHVIMVTNSSGWKGTNVDFFRDLDFIHNFRVTLPGLPLNILDELHWAKTIYLQTYPLRGEFRLSNLRSLEDIWLDGGKPEFFNGASNAQLIKVALWRISGKSALELQNLPSLETLRLLHSEVAELSIPKSLKLLQIVKNKNLKHVVVPEESDLRELEISGMKGLDVAEVTKHMTKLEILELETIGEFESLSFLKSLPRLQRLVLRGKTTVRDGDLSVLLSSQSLRIAAFDDRPHYSHTYKQIREQLASSQ